MSKSSDSVSPRLAADRFRPKYHFLPPGNWMNDPNGTIYWKGRYHLFYQYNPEGAFHGTIHWGHAVSEDLVHWTDLPPALASDPEGPDRDGCYSGTAFVNREGIPTIIYHGNPDGICIATAKDEELIDWQKHRANPVIPEPKPGDEYEVRGAPCAWLEGETYHAVTGGISWRPKGIPSKGRDRAFLFSSEDLEHWDYLHPFYEGGEYTEGGEDCAVPDFFPLGTKHMLLFASHLRGTQYYIGTYSDKRFLPERHGRLAYGDSGRIGSFCEGQTLLDDRDRRILFGRISECRYEDIQRDSGWAGILTLPLVLSLSDEGDLNIEPVAELKQLRGKGEHFSDIGIGKNAVVPIRGTGGDSLEIAAVFEGKGAQEYGLKVLCSPKGEEQTLVRFSPEVRGSPRYRNLILDVSRSSAGDDVYNRESQIGPLILPKEQPLDLRVFVDRSVVEVFANGRQYLTKRIYPVRDDSLGIQLFSRGGEATLRSMDVWQMDSIRL